MYDLDDIFNVDSIHYSGAYQFGSTPSFQNAFTEAVDPRVVGVQESGENLLNLGISQAFITVQVDSSIQDAIDKLNILGGGRVFLKNGTHKPPSDLTMHSNIYLQGENAGSAIIDFVNNGKGILIVGTNSHTAGTVAITNNSSTVTGVSTSWTDAMIGRKILLSGIWYIISARASGTSISISPPFAGVTLSAGTSYTLATLKEDIKITDLTIKNASSGIKLQFTSETFIRDVDVQTSVTGIDADTASQCSIYEVDLTANNSGLEMTDCHLFGIDQTGAVDILAGNGMTLNNVTNSSLTSMFMLNSSADGINITDSSNIKIDGTFLENGGQGIEFVSGNSDIIVSQSAIENNGSDGVKFTATSDNCFIYGSSIKNNGGFGVNIANANCDNTVITTCNFASNSSGAVDDNGTGTVIRGNVGVDDNTIASVVETFTSNDTYTKPTDAVNIHVQAWGAGGGGAGAAASNTGGGGGGGGAYVDFWFNPNDVGATETITVGVGGTGGTGDNEGTTGGNSSFGSLLTIYGGGGGGTQSGSPNGGGGGGGGIISAGVDGVNATNGNGGEPRVSGINVGFGGTDGGDTLNAVYGGSGGGSGHPAGSGRGGNSVYGGGGGSSGNATAGGTSSFAGNGGANSGVNTNGGDGSAPAGGGGGTTSTGTATNGGNGGVGRVIVTTFF